MRAQSLEPEFQVNTYTTDLQSAPAVAARPGGGFVVVWMSLEQDGSSWGIFGQRFDADSLPLGSEFRVNTHTSAQQMNPRVASDADGKFVVAWDSWQDGFGKGVYGRRFDADGVPLGGEFRVNVVTVFDQIAPKVAANGAGEFVVVWIDVNSTFPLQRAVLARRYDAAGLPVGGEITIVGSSPDPSPFARGVILDDAGEFVVDWTSADLSYPNLIDEDVFARRFDGGGPTGDPFQLNTYSTSDQSRGELAALTGGDFVVVWDSYDQDGSGWGIFGRRFDAAGTPLGPEFQVSSYTPNWQSQSAVAADGAGGFLVVWQSDGQDGSGDGIFAQRYDPAGRPVGAELQVNDSTTGDQQSPAVAARGLGEFVVTWQSEGQDGSNTGIFGRLVTARIFADGFETGDTSRWSGISG